MSRPRARGRCTWRGMPLIGMLVLAFAGSVRAQPGDPMPPEAADPGSADPNAGTDPDPDTSGVDPNTGGSSVDPNAGGSGVDPNAGSAADPNAGSGADPNAGATGSGTGSGSGPQIIQMPTDIAAPQVTAAASPTIVRLGGRFVVVIRATYGEGVEVNLREPVELGSVFEVRRKLSEDTKVAGGRTTREWQLEVTPWELGDLVMPPITITYTAFGRAGQVQTNRIRLKITGVLGDVIDDPKAMRGNAPPTDLSARDWFWLWVAIAGGALLGAVIAVVYLERRRRRRVTSLVAGAVARPRRMDMTSERALERLLAIERSQVLERDDDRKGGYLEMVEVIRDYLGARYRVHTSELTTLELVRQLTRVAPEEERLLVEAWLDACDLVRYGGLVATRSEAHQTLDDARALVVTTTQLHATKRPPGPPPTDASPPRAEEAA